ncbi:MAG: extracellular solute-binding protein [Planctomycetes bacterium]|nr:extracellular solute-binding protein [Planctomycetota bacterium]
MIGTSWTNRAFAFLVILALVGCGRPKPPPVDLRFAAGEWLSMLQADPIKAFVEARPHIQVAQVQEGAQADVVVLDSLGVTEAIRAGKLLNLLPKMEAVHFDLSQFFAPDIRCGARPDRYFALPVGGGGPAVIYFNADLFKKHNVPAPAETWEWSDFLTAAKTLTKDLDGDGEPDQFGFLVEPTADALLPWVWQAAGRSTRLDDPKAIKGIEFYADLVRTHKVSPPPAKAPGRSPVQLFREQRLAMFLGGPEHVGQLKSAGFNWNVQVPPKGPAGSATTVRQFFCAIGKDAQQPDAAWELVEFLTSSYVGMALMQSARLPARVELFRGFRLHGAESDWNMDAWSRAYEAGEHVPPALAEDERHDHRVSHQLIQLLEGKASPGETAKAVARIAEDVGKKLE